MAWIISAGRDSKDGGFFDCIIFENEIKFLLMGVFDDLII